MSVRHKEATLTDARGPRTSDERRRQPPPLCQRHAPPPETKTATENEHVHIIRSYVEVHVFGRSFVVRTHEVHIFTGDGSTTLSLLFPFSAYPTYPPALPRPALPTPLA